MRKLAVILWFCVSCSSFAATHTCADCSYASVNGTNQLAAVVDGDTISIPSGRCEWSSTLTVTKAIHLTGSSDTNTVILSGVADGTPMITWQLVAGKASRMSYLELTNGSVSTTFGQAVNVTGVNGDARSMRIDHCHFHRLTRGAHYVDTVIGVMDHCRITAPASGVSAWGGYIKGSSWNGTQGVSDFGDGAWAMADLFGTTNFWVIEDCVLTNEYTQHLTMFDAQAGGRAVVRKNTVGKGSLETHGLNAQRERSGRAFEWYDNDFYGIDTQDFISYQRGGVSLIYSNRVRDYGAAPSLSILENRMSESSCCQPFGGADGRNPWDVNETPAIVTGTCSSAGALTMTDSGKSWTVNQYRGYTLRKTGGTSVKTISAMSRSGSTVTVDTSTAHGFSNDDEVSVFGADQQPYNNLYTITVSDTDTFTFTLAFTPSTPATGTMRCCLGGWFSDITANTATQITFRDSAFSGTYTMVFSASDTYEINKVTHAMDMVGRSLGSNVGGADTPSLPGGWNDQVTSACYEWGNTNLSDATDLDFSQVNLLITENTHFINDTVKPGYTALPYPHYLVSGIPVSSGATAVPGPGQPRPTF